MMCFANSIESSHPKIWKIFVQAHPEKIGTTKLSSTWKGGTGIPNTFFGIVNAGVGTAKSANAPANPSSKLAEAKVKLPGEVLEAPHLAILNTR